MSTTNGKITIKVNAGSGNTVEVELEPNTTAGQAMANEIVKSVVNLGDSGAPLVNGTEVEESYQLTEADVLEIVKRNNKKGLVNFIND